MKPKLKPLTYLIAGPYIPDGWQVRGYAIECDLPVRLCVHNDHRGEWVCDHFDSGFRVHGPRSSISDAVTDGIKRIREAIASGEYAKKLIDHGIAA